MGCSLRRQVTNNHCVKWVDQNSVYMCHLNAEIWFYYIALLKRILPQQRRFVLPRELSTHCPPNQTILEHKNGKDLTQFWINHLADTRINMETRTKYTLQNHTGIYSIPISLRFRVLQRMFVFQPTKIIQISWESVQGTLPLLHSSHKCSYCLHPIECVLWTLILLVARWRSRFRWLTVWVLFDWCHRGRISVLNPRPDQTKMSLWFDFLFYLEHIDMSNANISNKYNYQSITQSCNCIHWYGIAHAFKNSNLFFNPIKGTQTFAAWIVMYPM